MNLPVGDMDEARLVLTEDLIRAALRRERAARKQRKARKTKPISDEALPGEKRGTR